MTGLTDDPFENPEHLANTADAMGRACKDWQESTAHYHFACRDTIRALHAQLAEAQAAQAALVERAAEEADRAHENGYNAEDHIRALASDAGVKDLAELRAERDRLAAELAEAKAQVAALREAGQRLYDQAAHVLLGAAIGKYDITGAAKNLKEPLDGWDAALAAAEEAKE